MLQMSNKADIRFSQGVKCIHIEGSTRYNRINPRLELIVDPMWFYEDASTLRVRQ